MGVFGHGFQQFTERFDRAGDWIGRQTGIVGYLEKKPPPGPPPAMPDSTSVLQSQQLQESKDAAVRYGRAATVLTSASAGGGASETLGP